MTKTLVRETIVLFTLLDCREWSVFAIRNMMADNLTNQKLVEKMKLDSVDTKVQDEISNMLGTKVKLDSYGKLHLQDDK